MNMRVFMSKVIGKEDWDELTGSIKMLGPSWNNKIMGIVLEKIKSD